MITIKREKEQYIVSFPQDIVSMEDIQDFISWLRLEEITKKSEISDEEVFALAGQVKKDWWERNKDGILKIIEE